MKIVLPLALSLSVLAGVACTHDRAAEGTTTTSTTAASDTEPSAKEGWNSVKSGAKEAGHGTAEIAKDAGNSVADGAKEAGHAVKEGAVDAGHAIKSAACPVLGNKLNKTYYTKTSKSYQGLLNGKNALSSDNRECFSSEANAREAGFKSAQ